jgi:hypothetical protein
VVDLYSLTPARLSISPRSRHAPSARWEVVSIVSSPGLGESQAIPDLCFHGHFPSFMVHMSKKQVALSSKTMPLIHLHPHHILTTSLIPGKHVLSRDYISVALSQQVRIM